MKGPGDGLGRTGAQTNIGFNHDDSTSILTNPEGNGTSDGNSCALSTANVPSDNGSDGQASTSLPVGSQLSTATDGSSSAPDHDDPQMNIESGGNDSTPDAANAQPNTSSDRNFGETKKLIRRTRSMGISEVDVSGNDELPALCLLMEAQFRWPPVSGRMADFCWNCRQEDVVGQEQPAVLAVNDGDRPIHSLAVETVLMKRAWDPRLKHFYWTVLVKDQYYIAMVRGDEVRRLVSAQGETDFHPIAFLPQVSACVGYFPRLGVLNV